MSAAIGMLSRWAIGASNPTDTRLDFKDGSNIGTEEDFLDGNGLRGTLSHDISRIRRGNRRVSGTLILEPNAAELTAILQWVLGGSSSGSGPVTYPLADTLITRYVAVDRNVGNLFTYDAVAVDRCVFRSDQGGIFTVTLDLVGKDETISGSFPSLSINTSTGPFIHTDCAIDINSTTVQIRNLEITIENMIDRDRFFNSQTLVTPVKQDRRITFRTELPFGDWNALYNLGPTGVAVAPTYTNGSNVLAFTMSKVTFPRVPFPAMGRRENMFELSGVCQANGSTKELVAVLTS